MHSRSGMATKYLSDEFMELVKTCVDKAENEGMRAYLYDEGQMALRFCRRHCYKRTEIPRKISSCHKKTSLTAVFLHAMT